MNGFSEQLDGNLTQVFLFPWYIPRDDLTWNSLEIKLRRDRNSYKEHHPTKRIDITLNSRSYRSTIFTMDPEDFRCTPTRTEIALLSRFAPLQLWVSYNSCEAEICDTRISGTIDEYISLKYTNKHDIHKETTSIQGENLRE